MSSEGIRRKSKSAVVAGFIAARKFTPEASRRVWDEWDNNNPSSHPIGLIIDTFREMFGGGIGWVAGTLSTVGVPLVSRGLVGVVDMIKKYSEAKS